MGTHTIRLRAPWKCERAGDRRLWRRAFGRPTNLSEGESVYLVLHSESASAIAVLNEEELGTVGAGGISASYDVTAKLAARNVLALKIIGGDRGKDGAREPPVEVRLEIRS